MNLSLTLRFDSIEELQSFLNKRGATVAALPNHDVSAAPTALEAVPPPVAAPAAAVTSLPDPLEVAPEQPVEDLRTGLMARLREMANGMDDPAVLGKFINGFGVTRFSEIDDEDLPAFKAALENEFGVA